MASVRTFVLVALCVFVAGCSGQQTPVQVGDLVGDFRLETLAHDRFYLNEQRGNIVVLVFWSTDCKHCKKEMIDLNDIWRTRWKRKGVILAAPCVDPEDVEELRQFAKNGPVEYPLLLDENMRVFRKYGFHFKPTTIVIDRQGVARLVRFGYSDVIAGHIEEAVRHLTTGANS